MKFKLDENLPELIHTTLVVLGHDAHTVAEERLAGASDDAVLRASIAERRVLITLDLDFADIRAYPPGSHAGIWALRPAVQTFRAIELLALAGLRLTSTERIHGQLWVIAMGSTSESATPNPGSTGRAGTSLHCYHLLVGAPVTSNVRRHKQTHPPSSKTFNMTAG